MTFTEYQAWLVGAKTAKRPMWDRLHSRMWDALPTWDAGQVAVYVRQFPHDAGKLKRRAMAAQNGPLVAALENAVAAPAHKSWDMPDWS